MSKEHSTEIEVAKLLTVLVVVFFVFLFLLAVTGDPV